MTVSTELNPVPEPLPAPGIAGLVGDERFVARGAAYFALPNPAPQRRDFHFLLLPRMTMLAFSAAIEPLRIANQLTGKVLYRWFLCSEDGAPVRCSNGVSIAVDGALGAIGRGDSAVVCSGTDGYQAASARTLAWLRGHARHGGRVAGLCTGAFTLARAGLLEGRAFTLHWEIRAAFEEIFPELPPEDALFAIDGNVLTCGGGNAAIDMMVSLIEKDHGPELALMVSDMCLHSGQRLPAHRQRSSVAAAIRSRHPALVRIVELMRRHIADDYAMEDILARESLSRRQVERLFRRHLDTTPARAFREMRLDHARSLMLETNMTVTEVALASGFQSADSFRKAFRARFGSAPAERHRARVSGAPPRAAA